MSNLTTADVVTYASYAIAAAAAAAAVLPQGKPGSAWYAARSIIDALAMNFANAKNAPK
jgi:hypothetical protein